MTVLGTVSSSDGINTALTRLDRIGQQNRMLHVFNTLSFVPCC
jgi:hypothetical protein